MNKFQEDMINLIEQFERKDVKVIILFDNNEGIGITKTNNLENANKVISLVLWPIIQYTMDVLNPNEDINEKLRGEWANKVNKLSSDAKYELVTRMLQNERGMNDEQNNGKETEH